MTPLTAALLVAITMGTSAAILAWRERPESGATWLTVLLVGQVWWATFLVFELEATSLAAKTLWYDVQWVGVVVIPVAWLLFALAYTGRNRFVTPLTVAGLLVVPLITVALALGGVAEGLLVVDFRVVETGAGAVLQAVPGPWYYVAAGYTYLLGLLGSVPILQLVRDDARPFRGQSAALLVGTAVPWASSVAHLTGVFPVPGLDPTPFAFAVSGVAYLLALSRFRLLTVSPAPRRRARQLVFENLHDPVFVVDTEGYVVDCNESAMTTFGLDRRSAVGESAHAVVPEYETFADGDVSANPVTIAGTEGNRPYDVSVRDVTNESRRAIGQVLVFHDVGEYLGQQQRLEVLDRVFRHNIRTEANLIHGYADRLERDPTDGDALGIVKRSAERITELSDRTRSASEMFDPDSDMRTPTSFDRLLATTTTRLREEYPHANVHIADDLPTAGVPQVMAVVVENLVSNAVRHNDAPEPAVWIDASTDDGWVELTVADDGPGIAESEYAVLDRGTETALEHGSGLGLWIVKWGTDLAGGEVGFEPRSPRGTRVTVSVPTLTAAETDPV